MINILLDSLKEPNDKQLQSLMKRVIKDVKKRSKKAKKELNNKVKELINKIKK